MKYLLFLLVLSNSVHAQYLETNLTESDLDPKPIVKDLGGAPKDDSVVIVDESKREIASESKKDIGRSPAVIIDQEKAESK